MTSVAPHDRGKAVVTTLCERCGRMSADRAVHNDLYHPMPRRRAPEPIAEVHPYGPPEPGQDTPEPEPAFPGCELHTAAQGGDALAGESGQPGGPPGHGQEQR